MPLFHVEQLAQEYKLELECGQREPLPPSFAVFHVKQ
jgi:hypothetical protein